MTLEISKWKEYVSYDPTTGEFTYTKSNHPKQKIGAKCLSTSGNGYKKISVNKHIVSAHRLAWALSFNQWPSEVIDHINLDRSDNRLVNLRAVSRSTNQENRKSAQSNSSTRLLGAFKYGQKYRSQIKAKGILYHLGVFNTAEEAHTKYIKAKRILHEGNTL